MNNPGSRCFWDPQSQANDTRAGRDMMTDTSSSRAVMIRPIRALSLLAKVVGNRRTTRFRGLCARVAPQVLHWCAGRPVRRLGSHCLRVLGLWLLATPVFVVQAEEVGSVDTKFKLIGPDHKVVIDAFDDEKVPGVACHLSRAVTGGVSGAVGLAEDTSDASIACRQVGPISFAAPIKSGERVFTERRSILFKKLQVVRFCDETRNTLVYLVYSDKIVDGSPKNAISTVPIMPWFDQGETPVVRCNDEKKGWFGND